MGEGQGRLRAGQQAVREAARQSCSEEKAWGRWQRRAGEGKAGVVGIMREDDPSLFVKREEEDIMSHCHVLFLPLTLFLSCHAAAGK